MGDAVAIRVTWPIARRRAQIRNSFITRGAEPEPEKCPRPSTPVSAGAGAATGGPSRDAEADHAEDEQQSPAGASPSPESVLDSAGGTVALLQNDPALWPEKKLVMHSTATL